jgi:hypothetical protein
LTPAVCGVDGDASNDIGSIARHSRFINYLDPNGGKPARVLNLKLFTETVTDSDPTEAKLSFPMEPVGNVPNPYVGDYYQASQANQ